MIFFSIRMFESMKFKFRESVNINEDMLDFMINTPNLLSIVYIAVKITIVYAKKTKFLKKYSSVCHKLNVINTEIIVSIINLTNEY